VEAGFWQGSAMKQSHEDRSVGEEDTLGQNEDPHKGARLRHLHQQTESKKEKGVFKE